MLEFTIGNKNADVINVHRNDPVSFEKLQQVLDAPSLYDEVLRLLSRRGYGIPEDYLSRNFSEPYQSSKQVAGAWLGVYHNSEKEWICTNWPSASSISIISSDLAVPSPESRRTHHRLQARHWWHQRRAVSGEGARTQVFSRTVAGADLDVTFQAANAAIPIRAA